MRKINWKQAEGTQSEQPDELEQAVNGNVILRRSITQEEREQEDGTTVTYWSYEEARLSEEEYAEYIGDMEAPSTQSVMQTLSDLQAEQELRIIEQDEATETIMQAISDLQADIALL